MKKEKAKHLTMADIRLIRNWVRGHFNQGLHIGMAMGIVFGLLLYLAVSRLSILWTLILVAIIIIFKYVARQFESVEFMRTLKELLFTQLKGGDEE